MPVWAVAFYDERNDFSPSRRWVVKAKSQGEAFELVKGVMQEAERADVTPQVVRDESKFSEGYQELPILR